MDLNRLFVIFQSFHFQIIGPRGLPVLDIGIIIPDHEHIYFSVLFHFGIKLVYQAPHHWSSYLTTVCLSA